MQGHPEQFIQFAVLLLSYIVGRELAYLVGPYLAIAIAASAGAALALGGSPAMRFRQVVFYVGLRIVMAMVLTVSIAELIYGWSSMSKIAALGLMPLIAFCIGVIRDYRAAFRTTLDFWRRRRRMGDR